MFRHVLWTRIVAMGLACVLPASASGGPLSVSVEKVMLGSGAAAVGVGAILLLTGKRRSSPVISARPGRVTVRHTIRF